MEMESKNEIIDIRSREEIEKLQKKIKRIEAILPDIERLLSIRKRVATAEYFKGLSKAIYGQAVDMTETWGEELARDTQWMESLKNKGGKNVEVD
jgi:hypothetical protein